MLRRIRISNAHVFSENVTGEPREVGKDAAPQIAEAEPTKIRFSAKSVVAQRNNLGISAADFGKLLGVTANTIYKWEHGSSRPRNAQMAAFAAIRGLGKTEALARLVQMRGKNPNKRKLKR